MKRWLIVVGLILAIAIGLWTVRAEIAIAGFQYLIESQRDVQPSKEIAWQRGPDIPQTPHSERPPNIVLILADDMGWNDVSTNGGGAGKGLVETPNQKVLPTSKLNIWAAFLHLWMCTGRKP